MRVTVALLYSLFVRSGWKVEKVTGTKYIYYLVCPCHAKRVLEHPGRACRADNLALSRRAPFILQHKHTHMKPLGMGKPEASEEGMGPMDKGRHRYAKGDYAGALVAFTQVSTSPSRSHLVAHWSSYML